MAFKYKVANLVLACYTYLIISNPPLIWANGENYENNNLQFDTMKKDEHPQFLLCENPITNESDGRHYIMHLHDPVIVAQVFYFTPQDEEAQMQIKRQITLGATLDYENEYFVFGAIFHAPLPDKWREWSKQQIDDKLRDIMKDMADWYEAYLIWEDSQNDNNDE